ncbi:MAG: hypothetical protein CME25_06365 [Gemmatimonadetes bacterium]|nr:hypothetical protein [Gemmatimonadota bacterium]
MDQDLFVQQQPSGSLENSKLAHTIVLAYLVEYLPLGPSDIPDRIPGQAAGTKKQAPTSESAPVFECDYFSQR